MSEEKKSLNKEADSEVLIQDQLIKFYISKELKRFKIQQTILNLIQIIASILLIIMFIKEREYVSKLNEQIVTFRELLTGF